MNQGRLFLAAACIFTVICFGVAIDCSDLYRTMLDSQTNYQACVNTCGGKPCNCADVQALGQTTSGLYTVYYLKGTTWAPVRVYCDMETTDGGWLVFQRRKDGHGDFYRNWHDYASGFGNVFHEFWLGNYHIHMLTSTGQYKLRIDLEDFEGEARYAEYSSFSVGDPSSKFELSVSGYSGDAGDALGVSNGMKFSTKDQDNDLWAKHCAVAFKGGWWYNACHLCNLNGLYLGGPHTTFADGIEWHPWHGYHYSLKFTEMKIKPV